MSRARDNANLGAQAGSGLDASDITTGTFPDTVTLKSSPLSHRNMIINGDMRVAQRGTGIVTGSADGFAVDRFRTLAGNDGQTTYQQVEDAPEGFKYSLDVLIVVADASLGTTQHETFNHRIEGQNIQHLAWGTSDAKTVTLSFYVKGSVAGTYSGAITNSAKNRSYPFTFAVTTSWNRVSITIAGDQTGTWLTTNGIGIQITWAIGGGSNYLGTAGAWVASEKRGVTGSTQLLSTASATLNFTGVQLELGSSATPFEHRSYGDELARCMRYCQVYVSDLEDATNNTMCHGWAVTTGAARIIQPFPVWFRAQPSLSFPHSATSMYLSDGATASRQCSALAINDYITARMMDLNFTANNNDLTAFRPYYLFLGNPSSFRLIFSAEL